MDKSKPSHRFKQTICDTENGTVLLIKDIVADLHSRNKTDIHPNLIDIANSLLQAFEPERLVDNFIEKSYEHWDEIASHSHKFFVNNAADVFYGLPEKYIESFRELFRGKHVVEEDLSDLWIHFTSMVKISIHYIHESREPKLVNGKPAYSNTNYNSGVGKGVPLGWSRQ